MNELMETLKTALEQVESLDYTPYRDVAAGGIRTALANLEEHGKVAADLKDEG